MKKQSAEDYLDKLLNSVNGEEEVSPFDMDTDSVEDMVIEPVEEKVTRRVSKSEEDFLREFEAELEADDFDDFLKYFDEDELDIQSSDVSYDGNNFVFENEKPAGIHGFVTQKEDKFVFEDGTVARFWGTNFNSAANFPSHEYSDMVAKRLAKFGLNLVRFHQMEKNI